jgi:hypothetical protein
MGSRWRVLIPVLLLAILALCFAGISATAALEDDGYSPDEKALEGTLPPIPRPCSEYGLRA